MEMGERERGGVNRKDIGRDGERGMREEERG